MCDERWHDLIVVLDDATSEIYYAQLVAEESTRTVMAALRHVVENKGWFSSIYSDRASHFFRTPKAGQPVDTREVTEVGRAMRDLGIRMIPAYSPQARGRSERNFGTWQGRLPQELRLKDIHTPEQANAFLRDHYISELNSKFTVTAAETGTAFAPIHRQDLDRVFAIQQGELSAMTTRYNSPTTSGRYLQRRFGLLLPAAACGCTNTSTVPSVSATVHTRWLASRRRVTRSRLQSYPAENGRFV